MSLACEGAMMCLKEASPCLAFFYPITSGTEGRQLEIFGMSGSLLQGRWGMRVCAVGAPGGKWGSGKFKTLQDGPWQAVVRDLRVGG